ncbi:MAG: carbamoyltransferase HypF [Thermodesulfobacteriota bacterium]
MTPADQGHIARRWKIAGIVQGVGFRPFVFQLATRHGLVGEVANTLDGVEIHAEGPAVSVDNFRKELLASAPPLSQITDIKEQNLPPTGSFATFSIAESRGVPPERPALISPDVAVCADCLRELFDPSDRRFHYPFINCTNCGPRYTIIADIPYDRPHTSMRHFRMCALCQAEYDDPSDRRFHAQPNACKQCGPQVTLLNRDGGKMDAEDPIAAAAGLLKTGVVMAVKGLGGFHLAVDARNNAAVEKLRRRKRREEKPFALMAPDPATIRLFADMSAEEERLLGSITRPIVLLTKRNPHGIAEQTAPRNRYFGVMLPYTPLHYLLLSHGFTALVMTSGNRSEEPIAMENEEAFKRLAGIADYFLVHNRDIYLRSDDSIVRHAAGAPRFIRRSRGFVPAPLFLLHSQPCVLGCGGELKNTVCLTRGDQAFLSQHIGDLENEITERFFEKSIAHMQRILRIEPELIAHDLHPDYLSTRYALARMDKPRVGVQHHHAHIVACMAENRLADPVIGLAFDGTGYGSDGRIWGGEVLLCRPESFQRLAHLQYAAMPGSAAAVREPWRMALAYLYAAHGRCFPDMDIPLVRNLAPEKCHIILRMMERSVNSPLTSSLGRLFDGVAALVGLRQQVRFEGQAAMELEMIADAGVETRYDFGWSPGLPHRIDLGPIVRGIVADVQQQTPQAVISGKFHATLVALFTELCGNLRRDTGINRVALSGGVFQNLLLFGGLMKALEREGFLVYTHRKVPCNDGGLSLGQAVAAAAMERKGQTR